MKQIFFLVFISLFFISSQGAKAAPMTTDYYFAWSNNYGYVTFENVAVFDTETTGYAWSRNAGWINMNPVSGGVRNDGDGNLSGFAWGEQLGWIDFSGVSINSETGKFSGQATGDRVGTLTFDCPTHCDVRTDWRKATEEENGSRDGSSRSERSFLPRVVTPNNIEIPANPFLTLINNTGIDSEVLSTSLPNSGILKEEGASVNPIVKFYEGREIEEPIIRKEINHVEEYNMPLTISSSQTGLLVWEFDNLGENQDESAAVTIEIPQGVYGESLTFIVELIDSGQDIVIDGFKSLDIFTVTAIDSNGEKVTKFLNSIKISLFSSSDFNEEDEVKVMSRSEESVRLVEWEEVMGVIYDYKKESVILFTDHLTEFGIFKKVSYDQESSFNFAGGLWLNLLFIVIVFYFILFFLKKRKEEERTQ